MATKTRTSAGGALALFAAVVIGLGFFYGVVKRPISDDSAGVTLTVNFEPTPRLVSVEILVLIDGSVHLADKAKKSPWERVVILRKGQRVVLTATQNVPGTLLCAINGDVQESTMFAGTVKCLHTRA